MTRYINAKKGTRYGNSGRNYNTVSRMAKTYKNNLNNTVLVYRNAGKSVRHSPTRGYVWNHPGLSVQLQKTLNSVRGKPERLKRYTAALKYASAFERARNRFNVLKLYKPATQRIF